MKKLTLDDFPIVIMPEFIRWEDLERIMGKRMYKKFIKFMAGQTCLQFGAYPDDVDRFLKGLPVVD